jgi:hypothetical protein
MLLSLVVIFTQSIQLSKIVERFLFWRASLVAAWAGLSILAQGSTSALDQPRSEAQPEAGLLSCIVLLRVVELNGIEPLTPCLQSRCSPN